jgi:hypothetical protein
MGFQNRGAFFRKRRAQDEDFRPEGATFIGKLSKIDFFKFWRLTNLFISSNEINAFVF